MYGSGPGECFEGNTTLAALSGHTTNVRLGLLVTGLTYRHPSVFAAEAITIDHASGRPVRARLRRRLVRRGAPRLGIPFPPTGPARRRVRGGGADRAGAPDHRRVHASRAATSRSGTRRCDPGRCSHRTRRSGSARRVSGCSASPRSTPTSGTHFGDPASLAPRSERLSELAAAAGRDPASILRAGSISLEGDLDEIRRTVDQWRDAGFGYLVAGWPPRG